MQQISQPPSLTFDLLGVLGTDHKALPAQNALVSDNMRLVAGKPNGLHRAMAYAFIAILTIRFLERQTI